ncbi:MAG: hypothetical protein Q8P67_22625, partial [archaeon]|nr:hypothetical protein [archaeon]
NLETPKEIDPSPAQPSIDPSQEQSIDNPTLEQSTTDKSNLVMEALSPESNAIDNPVADHPSAVDHPSVGGDEPSAGAACDRCASLEVRLQRLEHLPGLVEQMTARLQSIEAELLQFRAIGAISSVSSTSSSPSSSTAPASFSPAAPPPDEQIDLEIGEEIEDMGDRVLWGKICFSKGLPPFAAPPPSQPFDRSYLANHSLWLAYAAALSYCPPAIIKKVALQVWNFEEVHIFEHRESATRAIVLEADTFAILAFRGTATEENVQFSNFFVSLSFHNN